MRRLIWFIMFLALIVSARGQTAYSYRYWFDDNDTMAQTGSANDETTVKTDISSLAKGSVHALHLQAIDARDKWSAVRTTYFYIAKDCDTVNVTARYWFDDNEVAAKITSTVNGMIELDITELDFGIHAVHFQMFNAAGEASSVRTQSFYKKDESLLTSLSCHAWIDNNEDNAVTFCPVGDIVMDAPGLDFGMHNLHVVLLNVNGEKLIEKTVQFEVEDPDGVTFIPASALEDGAMFNVAGQRIQRMPKGIYIKGGKKVLVK